MTTHKERLEGFIEGSPSWLKIAYIFLLGFIKRLLAITGILPKLDKYSFRSQTVHYLRSLLAIHQLEDMIFLDIPWWTYEAIQAFETRLQQLTQPVCVFEYGSGASTIWLAKRCTQVISVEHDFRWYDKLKNKIIAFPHIQLLLKQPEPGSSTIYGSQKIPQCNFKSYVKAIEQTNQTFDFIIIDGRSREACLKACLPYLKQNGIIIFDNSNRKRYQEALASCGLRIERFYGRVPGSPFKSETAFLRKSSLY